MEGGIFCGVECKGRVVLGETLLQIPVPKPYRALEALNWAQKPTGSQCNSHRIIVICRDLLVPNSIRAAASVTFSKAALCRAHSNNQALQ